MDSESRGIFFDLLHIIRASKKRREKDRRLPTDNRMNGLFLILSANDVNDNLHKIARYGNYLKHRKLPVSKSSVRGYSTIHQGGLRIFARTGEQEDGPPDSLYRLVLPKPEKLDILPSEAGPDDMDTKDITVICEESYRWTIDIMGRIYEALVKDFRALS